MRTIFDGGRKGTREGRKQTSRWRNKQETIYIIRDSKRGKIHSWFAMLCVCIATIWLRRATNEVNSVCIGFRSSNFRLLLPLFCHRSEWKRFRRIRYATASSLVSMRYKFNAVKSILRRFLSQMRPVYAYTRFVTTSRSDDFFIGTETTK